MEAKAIAKFVRISPTKVQKVAGAVKGKPVEEALTFWGLCHSVLPRFWQK